MATTSEAEKPQHPEYDERSFPLLSGTRGDAESEDSALAVAAARCELPDDVLDDLAFVLRARRRSLERSWVRRHITASAVFSLAATILLALLNHQLQQNIARERHQQTQLLEQLANLTSKEAATTSLIESLQANSFQASLATLFGSQNTHGNVSFSDSWLCTITRVTQDIKHQPVEVKFSVSEGMLNGTTGDQTRSVQLSYLSTDTTGIIVGAYRRNVTRQPYWVVLTFLGTPASSIPTVFPYPDASKWVKAPCSVFSTPPRGPEGYFWTWEDGKSIPEDDCLKRGGSWCHPTVNLGTGHDYVCALPMSDLDWRPVLSQSYQFAASTDATALCLKKSEVASASRPVHLAAQ